MKIDSFGSITTGNTTGKRRIGGTGSFSDLLAAAESDAGQAGPASDVAATASLNNFLALQEISEEDLQRKKLVQHGNNLLDELEKFRRQLLTGSISLHVLQNINHRITSQRPLVADPRLLAIIDDIELRAAVELAKLQHAIDNDK